MSNTSPAELSALPPVAIQFDGFDDFGRRRHFIDEDVDVWGLVPLGVELAGGDSDRACAVMSVTPDSIADRWGMKKDVTEGPDCRRLTIAELDEMLVM